jgi:hypothetical protein
MSLQPPLKLFSVEEANRLLPGITTRLAEMRATMKRIQALQGKVDIEELTGTDGDGKLTESARDRIVELNEALWHEMDTMESQYEEFQALGCELKDLERGLVDFYTRRNGHLCYLCWQEGEDEIRYWHPLEGGFQARQPL